LSQTNSEARSCPSSFANLEIEAHEEPSRSVIGLPRYAWQTCPKSYIVFFAQIRNKGNEISHTQRQVLSSWQKHFFHHRGQHENNSLPEDSFQCDPIGCVTLVVRRKIAMRTNRPCADIAVDLFWRLFNDWVWKMHHPINRKTLHRTGEYEIFEFGWAKIQLSRNGGLILASFMVERPHFSPPEKPAGGVATRRPSPKIAKVRFSTSRRVENERAYCEIEFFRRPQRQRKATFRLFCRRALWGKRKLPILWRHGGALRSLSMPYNVISVETT